MRIIQLTRCTSWGGGERYALDLCDRLSRDGHKVSVVTRGIPAMDARFSHLPVSMVKMPLGGILDLTSPRHLAHLIENYPEPEVVVHVHNFKDAEIAARAKLLLSKGKTMRLVCTRHLVRPGKGGLRWKWLYGKIDSLIFVSQLALDKFLSTNPPVDPSRLHVIHNSIIPPSHSATHELRETHVPLNVLYTGRIASEKGIDILLKSIALLKGLPMVLTMAGTGEENYIAELKDLAEKLSIFDRIQWLGFVSDVYQEIARADICVLPTVAQESFGLTVLEYMSQARPVITTDNGAQPEIITDGRDGLLVPPSNPEALAEAIRRLAENPEKRHSIALAGHDTFLSRFTYDNFYHQILQQYNWEGITP